MVFRLILGIVFAAPLLASAAFIPTLGPTVDISLSPESPRPEQTVNVRAEGITNPSAAIYVWRVNGSIVDQGIGIRGTTITVGRAGTETVLSVSVSENGVPRGDKTITIRPAEVDLVWEGLTYTPPFFSGRPLLNPSATVKVMAVPTIVQNGVRLSPSEVVYTWYLNGSQTPLATGYGRASIALKPPTFANAFSLSVSAATRDGSIVAQRSATIQPVFPDIVIYEKPPLLGVRFDHAVDSDQVVLGTDEATFVAFPLYVRNVDAPAYSWTLDGREVSGASPREITFRKEGEGRGSYAVEFSLANARALFERASAEFRLNF